MVYKEVKMKGGGKIDYLWRSSCVQDLFIIYLFLDRG
jgi:hypothetical protein